RAPASGRCCLSVGDGEARRYGQAALRRSHRVDARRRLRPQRPGALGCRPRQGADGCRRVNSNSNASERSMETVMPKTQPKHADIKEMTFERALEELESIFTRLERGDVELEESIAIYERGEVLKEHCDRLLRPREAHDADSTYALHGH